MSKRRLRFSLGHGMFCAGGGATVLLALMLVALFCPCADSMTHATSSVKVQVNAIVQPSISVSAPSSMNLELNPADKNFQATSGKLSVITNNPSGYKILVNSINTTSLTSYDKNNDKAIASIVNPTAQADFPGNTWGYYLGADEVSGELLYQPASTTATAMINTDGIPETNNYNLSFGVKIDSSLPAGTYSSSILISAVANPLEIHSLMELTYMQDMTDDICENTVDYVDADNYATKQLIDSRDGKSYWVAKLADGKCWMTQNLALDIAHEDDTESETEKLTEKTAYAKTQTGRKVKLSNLNTDITAEQVALSATISGINTPEGVGTYTTWSWNVGNYVLVTPLASELCSSTDVTGKWNTVLNGQDLGEICANFWQVQDDYTPSLNTEIIADEWRGMSAVPKNADGEVIGQGMIAVDEVNKTYDAHYSIGNYYQFNTATAGSGGQNASLGVSLSASICPKGWRLPMGGRILISDDGLTNADTGNEFIYMLYKMYGYDGQATGLQSIHEGSENYQDVVKGATHLVRAGLVNSTSLGAPGQQGFLWSGTGYYDSTRATNFYMTGTQIAPAAYNVRNGGYPLRCIAK